jgi:hypothetical protein
MEVKYEIFKRIPPGDRWVEMDENKTLMGDKVFPSLTEALEHYFQKTKVRQYFIDAAAGLIYKVTEEADPVKPVPSFSIYGEY